MRTITVLNRKNAKLFALKVSTERRAGTFTRVAESFLQACEADIETRIRQICGTEEMQLVDSALDFVTKTARNKATEKLDLLCRSVIQAKVQRHPTIGTTLKN